MSKVTTSVSLGYFLKDLVGYFYLKYSNNAIKCMSFKAFNSYKCDNTLYDQKMAEFCLIDKTTGSFQQS